jgi:hypothetical protein
MFRRTLLSLVATAALAFPTVPALAAHVTKHHLAATKHHKVMLSATKAKTSKLATSAKRHTLHTSKITSKRLHATHASGVKKLTSLSAHTAKRHITTHHKAKAMTTRTRAAVDPLA